MALADVTGFLLALAWRDGDDAALTRLMPLVEQELHRIAQRHMAGERPGHSLQATALVNEVYLRLINVQQMPRKWALLGFQWSNLTRSRESEDANLRRY